MPTYDYRCNNCQHRWELSQSIMADPIKKCPKCGKAKAERVIGAGAGVIFKGSGFYQTDYRSDAYKKAADADKKASDGSAGKSDGAGKSDKTSTSSETKSPPKSDPKPGKGKSSGD